MKKPNTKEDNWVWSPQGIIDMHRTERWGFVQFEKAETAPANGRATINTSITPLDTFQREGRIEDWQVMID
ncbi:MAG: hypothetical protein ACK5YR_05535 [Pirellula sp.]